MRARLVAFHGDVFDRRRLGGLSLCRQRGDSTYKCSRASPQVAARVGAADECPRGGRNGGAHLVTATRRMSSLQRNAEYVSFASSTREYP